MTDPRIDDDPEGAAAPGEQVTDPAVEGDPQAVADVQADGTPPGAPGSPGASAELAEQRDRYLRLAAEYDNYRRRTQRERLEAQSRGQADLVKQLIDPLDDLSRFAHLDPAVTDSATVVQGAEMVERKLHKLLAAAGLEIINPENEPFDPAVHEAVMSEPATTPEDDHRVGRVFQVGYRFGGQLLRPARVVVKQWNG